MRGDFSSLLPIYSASPIYSSTFLSLDFRTMMILLMLPKSSIKFIKVFTTGFSAGRASMISVLMSILNMRMEDRIARMSEAVTIALWNLNTNELIVCRRFSIDTAVLCVCNEI